jgi:hypothetical protein
MNLDNDVVYRCRRLGPLHQRHPGRSRSLIRHYNRLHQVPPPVSSRRYIAADAGVTRPTLYRRWKNKLDLVVDALDYGQDCCMSASKALNTNPLAIRIGLGGE